MQIGFVNGCFDVLHLGHLRLFQFAKQYCDFLVVAIDSDTRVRDLKGSDRPLNNETARKEMLLALRTIDAVEIFDSAEELDALIKNTCPDIMVVGSDYRNRTVVGAQHAKQLLFFERIEGYSTSKILEGGGDR